MDESKREQIRKQKGFEIANKKRILFQDGIWLVPSQSQPDRNYLVMPGLDKSTCTCKDFDAGLTCKHIYAVKFRVVKELNLQRRPRLEEPQIKERPTFPQNWPAYNKAQTQEKELFMKLLNELCLTIPQETASKGRGRPTMPMHDMVFSSALKVFTTF